MCWFQDKNFRATGEFAGLNKLFINEDGTPGPMMANTPPWAKDAKPSSTTSTVTPPDAPRAPASSNAPTPSAGSGDVSASGGYGALTLPRTSISPVSRSVPTG